MIHREGKRNSVGSDRWAEKKRDKEIVWKRSDRIRKVVQGRETEKNNNISKRKIVEKRDKTEWAEKERAQGNSAG